MTYKDRIGAYRITSKCPEKPFGLRLIELPVIIDPSGGNALGDIKRLLIIRCLEEFNGNTTATARALGVTTRTMCNWLNRHPELRDYASKWSNEIESNS